MGAPLVFSLLFLLVGSAQAYVYSCEEVKYKLLNSDIGIAATTVCVRGEEGYKDADAILGGIDLHKGDHIFNLGHLQDINICAYNNNWETWRIVADPAFYLDCTQEFSLIFTSFFDFNPILTLMPQEQLTGTFVYPFLTLVSPRTGIALRKQQCNGDGLVTVYTGAGTGENEERFPMQSWRCSKFPEILIVFDNVITLDIEPDTNMGVTWTTHDYTSAIKIGDDLRVAIMSSGRSDNLQNAYPKNNVATIDFEWITSPFVNIFFNAIGTCVFDARYDGFVDMVMPHDQENWTYRLCDENLPFRVRDSTTSSSLTVAYKTGKVAPSDVWNSQDNFVIEISLHVQFIYTSPAPQAVEDPYCSCALDNKFGMPENWNSTDIWIDVIVILDTSEAMGDVALIDASTLIESFIGTDDGDVLITDTTANFYTRVGLIAMADKAEVLYNLNMTKADKVVGKAQVKKGLTQINVVDAFNAAMNMFADGLKDKPERVNTRQVIYYMTNSDPKTDLTSMNQFKTSYGIIIVNNFVESGVTERPGLRNLASDGYYYTDIQYNYMATIQLFCKANCFCRPDLNRTPYAGNNNDPAVKASGGCLRAVPAGVQYSKARMNCDSEGGGQIVSIHDENKADFVNQLMNKALPSSSDYYWIGYSKTDAGWAWEDQSPNPYTNWDVANGEPSSASVAKCAYVDRTTKELLWGAGNCNVGFPFACEFAPCAVGNKNC